MPLPGEGVVNPRDEIMADIQMARQEQLAQEFKEGGGDLSLLEPAETKPDPKPEVKEEPVKEGEEKPAVEGEEKTEVEAGTETPPEDPPAKPKVKIKVDGQELEVDEEAVREAGIKALQKQSAADKRLEESARLKKEAEAEARRILEEAKRQAAQPNQDVTQPPQQGATSVERLTDDRFIETVKKVQYGGEAEAGQALKDLISEAVKAGKSPELTLNEVGEYLEFREATKWAHDEYKEILGDPKLKTLFSSEEKRLRATGDMRPYREVYSDIGNGLREWLKEKVPAPAPAAPPTRQERKASVVVIPTAAARQPAPTQPKEPTPSEVIDRIRAARHQA